MSVEASDKKRKATSNLENRSKKKRQTSSSSTTETIRVEHVPSNQILKPIIATTPGASFPHDVKFNSYTTETSAGQPKLLIQSSDHPTIDYLAVEGADPSEEHSKHYIAVYDPKTSSLKLTEAKSLTVRGSIRQQQDAPEDGSDSDTAHFVASQGTRAALTEAFGSKKSRKAVQSMAENRQLGQGLEGATIAEAMTSKINEDDEIEDEDMQDASAARSNKPLPQPNLATDEISEVYSIASLVFPQPAANTLLMMPLDNWRARVKAGKDITNLRSRFVANRVVYTVKHLLASTEEHDLNRFSQQAQLLRYIALLLEIHFYIAKQDRRRKMEFVDKWPEGTTSGNISPGIIKQVVNRYFPENVPNERAMTIFRTSILALTLHILPPSGKTGGNQLVAEPTDIQLDLAMKLEDIRKWYHELGCKMSSPTEKDLTVWGLRKLIKSKKKGEDGPKLPKPVVAVLKFPLDFPKMGRGAKARR